ncbi:hypothetical protein ACFLZH_05105 [Patescibacteria group bacterium]
MSSENPTFNEKVKPRATTADLLRVNASFLLKNLYETYADLLDPAKIIAFAKREECLDFAIKLGDHICIAILQSIHSDIPTIHASLSEIRQKFERKFPELAGKESNRLMNAPIIGKLTIDQKFFKLAVRYLVENMS